MKNISTLIINELKILKNHPFQDCWRASNMQIFEFGPVRKIKNKKGEIVKCGKFNLHVQCQWRMVHNSEILFARGDLFYPADDKISLNEYDYEKDKSILDTKVPKWNESSKNKNLIVRNIKADNFGGLCIIFDDKSALEIFPCHSRNDDYSEYWRFFGHRRNNKHFVIDGKLINTSSSNHKLA